ncbi:glycine receptor subunit alpha-4-like [Penaeus vannamei]|uniref:glycine receptor subunit alpha-4-like n=1 Tax=Penaeus vannamei TaxID=6689 RepID=UPI00387F9B3A
MMGDRTARCLDNCQGVRSIEMQGHPILSSIIPCNYIKEYRPPTDRERPVQVEFTMFVQDINSINAADMDFRVDLFLHMSWEDTRLNLTGLKFIAGRQGEDDYLSLPAYVIDFIWVPDPYVTNSKDAAITKLTTTYASVTLYKNHTIRYSARVYSIIGCQMEFHEYPMDVQTCSMIMQSYIGNVYAIMDIEVDANIDIVKDLDADIDKDLDKDTDIDKDIDSNTDINKIYIRYT